MWELINQEIDMNEKRDGIKIYRVAVKFGFYKRKMKATYKMLWWDVY
jgi:hypothetical protein